MAYWYDLWTNTRKDRMGHKYRKGFLELKF